MKVLIAEDDFISSKFLENFLGKMGYSPVMVQDGLDAWRALRQDQEIRLIVSDWMMPRMDGVELCRRIRSENADRYLYFIIITARENREDVIEGLEAGADDFIVKPFNPEELKCRIKIGERILGLQDRILQLACTDSLTLVLTRRALYQRLEEEIQRASRGKTPLSVIMADIDHFKAVNDKHGHSAGDVVLQQFAAQLRLTCRGYDFIGRYGGEEFVICLPGTRSAQAMDVADRMRSNVASMQVRLPGTDEPVAVTGSFGVAAYSGENSQVTPEDFVDLADKAMYEAKSKGRNCICAAPHVE